MPIHVQKAVSKALPNWVPVDVQNYLLHTETGLAIRYLARQMDVMPQLYCGKFADLNTGGMIPWWTLR